MLEKKIAIINKLGLHARAAAKFVSCASRFGCEVEVFRGSKSVNGKSIMGVMMLAASKGTEILVRCNGPDEVDALTNIEALIKDKFGEEE